MQDAIRAYLALADSSGEQEGVRRKQAAQRVCELLRGKRATVLDLVSRRVSLVAPAVSLVAVCDGGPGSSAKRCIRHLSCCVAR